MTSTGGRSGKTLEAAAAAVAAVAAAAAVTRGSGHARQRPLVLPVHKQNANQHAFVTTLNQTTMVIAARGSGVYARARAGGG